MGARRLLVLVLGLGFLMMAFPAVWGLDRAAVMFDLGDGRVLWGQAEPQDGWNVTLHAAQAIGLGILYHVHPVYGVFVDAIGGRTPTGGEYWHLVKWNTTSLRWDPPSTGASSLAVQRGEAIGWFITDDIPPQYLPSQLPLATPLHPNPVAYFRYRADNTGEAPGPGPSNPGLAWSFRVPGAGMATAIDSTPAVANGVVYVESFAGLSAVDAATGQGLWNISTVRGMGSPALHNGNLTIGAVDGDLYYLRGSDGTILWHLHLVDHGQYKGLSSSPKVLGGRAYLGTYDEGGGPGEVVSVDLSKGTIAWRVPAHGSVDLSSPAVVNGTLYIGVAGKITSQLTLDRPYGLLALNATDGRELWFHPANSPVVSSPVVVGDRIFYTEKAGFLVSVDRKGTEIWRHATGGGGTSSPAFAAGHIFVATGVFDGTGAVRAFGVDGAELWSQGGFNGGIQASPTFAEGVLYVSTNARNGTIYALRANDGTFLWFYTPTPRQYLLASPVVAEGRLYQGSDSGFLFALVDTPSRSQESPSPSALVVGVVLITAGVVVAVATLVASRRRRGHG